ncbi:hypothetical protein [Larkinella terrae]|uniref:Uncharacterized protein n=1 Tax=Larkinella terrae TaxID=2025311 RepID=A0A7K0EJZ1_9BACT|nr:hypothetical protein [Larkinella terrae]MRS61786.1 hypothetical protein [Larkinella terrae]
MWFEFSFNEIQVWICARDEQESQQDIRDWRRTRKQLTQIYNLFADKKFTDAEFLPLPGDAVLEEVSGLTPKAFFKIIATTMSSNGKASR